MLKRVGDSRHPCRTPTVIRNHAVSYAAVEEDCTSGLVIEVCDDSDKDGADVVLLNGCPQSSVLYPVEGPLEVYEYVVEDLLVLEIFLTEDS